MNTPIAAGTIVGKVIGDAVKPNYRVRERVHNIYTVALLGDRN